MNITANEKAVLKSIESNFFGHNPGDWLWSDSINESVIPSGVTGKALSGVCASLVNKGLIDSDGVGRESCVRLTESGITVLQEGV